MFWFYAVICLFSLAFGVYALRETRGVQLEALVGLDAVELAITGAAPIPGELLTLRRDVDAPFLRRTLEDSMFPLALRRAYGERRPVGAG